MSAGKIRAARALAAWAALGALCAAAGAGAEPAPAAAEGRSVSVAGLEAFEGVPATIAVLRELAPHAGGSGRAAGGKARAPLFRASDRVTPWAGSGEFTVWVVLGDVTAAKKKADKAAGLAARVFTGVEFGASEPVLRWEDGKPLPKFDLEEFAAHY